MVPDELLSRADRSPGGALYWSVEDACEVIRVVASGGGRVHGFDLRRPHPSGGFMEIPTFVGGDVVPSAAANASALEVLRAEAQPSDSVHLTFSPSYERALKVRVGDEPPDDPLDVYWEWEADVPPELVVDDDPTRLPVEHLGISFDGRGYLLLLFNGLWGQRNDYWADTLDDACELAQRQYGVTRNIWRRTGGSFDQPLMRPLPP